MNNEKEKIEQALTLLKNFEEALNKIDVKKNEKPNVFYATGMTTQEIKHSFFIAWLLNPQNPHGLGNAFLKIFLRAVQTYPQEIKGKTNAQILNLSEAELTAFVEDTQIKVETERSLTIAEGGRIDICLEAPQAKTVLVIENKVFTSTHDEQLTRYEKEFEQLPPDWKKIFIYLTPEGDPPYQGNDLCDKWCIFSYEELINLIKELKPTNRKIKYLTEDYIDMVNTEILKNNKDIASLCRKIRKDHKEAINILLNYTDNAEEVIKYCVERLKSAFTVKEIHQTALSASICTKKIAELFAKHGEGITLENGSFKCRYEIGCKDGPILLSISMETANGNWSAPQLFIKDCAKYNGYMGNKYCTLFNKIVLLPEEGRMQPFVASKSDEYKELKIELDKKINEFLNKIIPIEEQL